jgi:hypothetical protein
MSMAAMVIAGVACSTPREAGNAGNASNSAAATNAAPVVDTGEQAYGRAAMRLQIKYTPERTVTGGVAFAVDAPGGPIVITSAHIVATMSKGKKLDSVAIVDGVTREPLCKTLGVVWAGTAFEGFDFSKDITALAVDGLPDSVTRLRIATDRPALGARVRILGVPSDGSSAQIAIDGVVTVATSVRYEIDIDPSVKGRGLAGAAIVLVDTGQVVGVVQAVTAKQGRAFVIATPAEAFLKLLPASKPVVRPISVWTGVPPPKGP